MREAPHRGGGIELLVNPRGGGIELLGHRDEGYPVSVKQLDQLGEVRQQAGQAVDPFDRIDRRPSGNRWRRSGLRRS